MASLFRTQCFKSLNQLVAQLDYSIGCGTGSSTTPHTLSKYSVCNEWLDRVSARTVPPKKSQNVLCKAISWNDVDDHTISLSMCSINYGRKSLRILQWCHSERDGVSPASPLFAQPFVQALIKENTKLRVTGFCEGTQPVTCGFPLWNPLTEGQ